MRESVDALHHRALAAARVDLQLGRHIIRGDESLANNLSLLLVNDDVVVDVDIAALPRNRILCDHDGEPLRRREARIRPERDAQDGAECNRKTPYMLSHRNPP